MASIVQRPEKDAIAREILAYLADHPDAGDTLEGIALWWLLESKIKRQERLAKKIIRDLIDKGFLLEQQTSGSSCRYRINPDKKSEIEAYLKR